tara:strand:+ start:5739 stop:5990 length:252 start_codon:yes stop_codon:yes gene_type:complete
MMSKQEKRVEFRIVEDEELPAIIIKRDGGLEPVIVINTYHKIWLSLQRATIPGITNSLAEKLTLLCDGFLEEQLQYEDMDRMD